MHDRVCPIGDCTATVRFEESVVEVTPRYQLHDLGAVDEFAVCPNCEAEVAGYYGDEQSGGATDGEAGVEVILDIDDELSGSGGGRGSDDGDSASTTGERAHASDEASADAPAEASSDDAKADGDEADADDEADDGEAADDEDDYEPVFTQSTDDFDDPEAVLDAVDDEGESSAAGE